MTAATHEPTEQVGHFTGTGKAKLKAADYRPGQDGPNHGDVIRCKGVACPCKVEGHKDKNGEVVLSVVTTDSKSSFDARLEDCSAIVPKTPRSRK